MITTWPLVPLGEVLRRANRFERKDDLDEYQFAGTYSYARGIFVGERKEGVSFGLDKIQRVKTGDFVYCKIMAWEGAFGIVPDEADNCVMSGAFVSYEVNRERIDPKYLDYYFKIESVWKSIGGQSTGTNVRRRSLHPDQFEKAIIPLPPLTEQHRIVARVEELATKIEEARGLRQKAVEEAEILVASNLANLFAQGAMDGWKSGVLGDYLVDCTYGTSVKTNDDASGVPIFRMGNIQNGKLESRDLKYFDLTDREKRRLLLERGDILVNRTNSAELVGKCAVFDLDGDYSFASYLIRLRLDVTRASPGLVAAFINSPTGRAYMFSERTQMTGQANVNSTKLKALPMALPDLIEQRRIVAYLDDLQSKVEALKKLQEETAKELDAMLPSVLDKAFRGNCRCWHLT